MARTRLQALGLSVLNRISGSAWPDRTGIRSPMERIIYWGSREGFRLSSTTLRHFQNRSGPRARLSSAPQPELFDLSLDDEQQQITNMLQKFAENQLRPVAHAADEAGRFPDQLRNAAGELGLVHYAVSDVYGGVASIASSQTQALIAETLAHGDFSLTAALLAPVSVANALTRWGSAEQQARYLPEFVSEEKPLQSTMAVMEPGALFNPFKLSTTASRSGNHYRINGQKTLVLAARTAELFLVAAQTPDGPGLFLIEGGQKGLQWKPAPAMGLKAGETADLFLKDVTVSTSARLGDDAFSWSTFLDYGSLAWCAMATGCAQAVLDYSIPYCNERHAFGEPISHRQGVAFLIAQMAIEVESMRLMTWRATSRADQGTDFHREAYLARMFCAEKAMWIGTQGVQLLGGHGFTKEHPVERWYRDLRSIAVLWGGQHL